VADVISYAYEGSPMESVEDCARAALQVLKDYDSHVPCVYWIFNKYTLKLTRKDDVASAVAKWDECKRKEYDRDDKAVIDRAFELGMTFRK
jgi:hypothetical protein